MVEPVSTWICGCDPEANWSCDNPTCDYRRYMSVQMTDRPLPDIDDRPQGYTGVREAIPLANVEYLGPGTVFGPGSETMIEACTLVNGARQSDYGTPRSNYEGIAKVWSGILHNILKRDITPDEAALLMVGLKLQRQAMKHKHDNLVDAHGYLLVYEHIRGDDQS